jgi:hypothetical protein
MIPLYKILYFIGGMDSGRMEKMGMHNRPEDDYSARDTYLPTLLNVICNLQLS